MLKFMFKTLGCKVNQAESETLISAFKEAGLAPASHSTAADLYIINTCTVTQRAAMQSRQAIRQAMRANPGARVMVTGCYAQTAPEEIRRIDGIDVILGNTDKSRLVEYALERIGTPYSSDRPHTAQQRAPDCLPASSPDNRSRPLLKVQDGCEAFCTYCIVPYARGPSRSRPQDDIHEAIGKLKASGFCEIVLTGIHLGNYGLDLSPPTDLLSLLRGIRKAGAIDRIRLSSIEPGEISDMLIRFVAESSSGAGRICPHFHIPLQSGDDDILKRMNRPYTSRLFEEQVWKINGLLPDAAIGADILVGFPGESSRAFERTCGLIEQLPVSYLHVFPFSPRKGTPAWDYSDRVPIDIIRERCQTIRELGHRKKIGFYRKFIGRERETIFDARKGHLHGFLKGVTDNYIPVLVKDRGASAPGLAPVAVTIDRIDKDLTVYGKEADRHVIHRPG